jgi:mono/diheme cytochrome c family protein
METNNNLNRLEVQTMKSSLFVVLLVLLGLASLAFNAHPQRKKTDVIARGRYLVTSGQCNDCHSPKLFTAKGPVIDSTRLLSGHPATSTLPEIPKNIIAPDKWGALASNDFTAWVGPWGVSFTRNLTPDTATGLGSWTPEMFIKAMRTGKDMGEGRDILPPMPWFNVGQMSNQDLRAMFAYLRSLKPIENAVPDPISPSGETLPTGKAAKMPPK